MTLAGEDPVISREYAPLKSDEQRAKFRDEAKAKINKLNQQICDKIANNFTSVNKAFLTID